MSTVFDFTSAGVRCAATHFAPPVVEERARLETGAPVVVLAHGLAGTQDAGVFPFAEAFAAAGLHAVTFDYRGFGGSDAADGEPRQVVSLAGQVADLHAAVDAAKCLPGVDPTRVVLWGVSLGGGHVVSVAAERDDITAVVSVVPMVDGLAAARLATQHHRPSQLLASTGRGLASAFRRKVGRRPAMIPVVAHPGETGALTLPGAYEDYLAIAGPTWRNEIAADVVLELGTRAPAKAASRLEVPWLVQVADFDRSAPLQAAMKAAVAGRAEVRHYPGDHFDLFAGKPFHEPAVEHALHFLLRHLTVTSPVLEPARG
ncbi:alpha/beta hydrolase [Nocardioides daeguensis]|uniref:Alpha/beta hydrolase n=1 Tax=Nocardioides daeguensis TaxID=908359 RepID=A0ABP6W7X5_9ACTN|nr:alpha/beta fold hydrolase [Nocardioides daeguensis]MBV6727859.1 alpha/beta hydrolase [Nocardioides daeguensis]MCR1775330.1 alpha/beta hydrolase [Nocardioides daeguensis]